MLCSPLDLKSEFLLPLQCSNLKHKHTVLMSLHALRQTATSRRTLWRELEQKMKPSHQTFMLKISEII